MLKIYFVGLFFNPFFDRIIKSEGDLMKNALSLREQKYYLAAFKTKGTEKLSCENGLRLFQFADVHCKTTAGGNAPHEQRCTEITFVVTSVFKGARED